MASAELRRQRSGAGRYWLIFCLALMLPVALVAQSLDTDSPEAVEARRLYLKAGQTFPLYVYPIPRVQLAAALEQLAVAKPSVADAARDLARRLGATDSAFFADVAMNGTLRLNHEAMVDIDPVTVLSLNGFDLQRQWLGDAPFFGVRLGADGAYGFSGDAMFLTRREWSDDWNNASNVPILDFADSNPVKIDNHIMERGDLIYSNPGFDIAVGRSPVHLGIGGFSTLNYSDRLPYLDRIHLRTYGSGLGFDYVVATLPAVPSFLGEEDAVDLGERYGWESPLGNAGTSPQTAIVLAWKRFQIQLSTLTIGLAEAQVYSRPNNAFTLTDFIPVLDWHATDMLPNNNSLLLDVDWAIAPGWRVWAMAGLDDVRFGTGGSDSDVPTIPAALLGAEAVLGLGDRDLDLRLESGYTHYLWGNFDGQATAGWDKNPLGRAIYRMKVDGGALLLPLTSPYGPGAWWVHLDADLPLPEILATAGLRFRLLGKQPAANLVTTPFAADSALEAMPFTWASLTLPLRFRWEFLEWGLSPGLEGSNTGLRSTLDLELTVRQSTL